MYSFFVLSKLLKYFMHTLYIFISWEREHHTSRQLREEHKTIDQYLYLHDHYPFFLSVRLGIFFLDLFSFSKLSLEKVADLTSLFSSRLLKIPLSSHYLLSFFSVSYDRITESNKKKGYEHILHKLVEEQSDRGSEAKRSIPEGEKQ